MQDFNNRQTERIDAVHQKVADLMEFLLETDGFDSAEVADASDRIADVLSDMGYEVYFPTRLNGKVYDIYPY